jgi:transposase
MNHRGARLPGSKQVSNDGFLSQRAIDVPKLLTMLLRHRAGEKKVWSVVRVPCVEDEERRQLPRELLTAKRDRTRVTNRIQGLLASHGLGVALPGDVPTQLSQLRQGDGSPLPPALRARLEAKRRQLLHTSVEPVMGQVRPLNTLRGIGTNSAWLYGMEFFAWREFRNRKQVGALAGLTPTPHQSGQSCHELGIAKAGNRHIRAMAIEIAWGWLRFQPESALSRWSHERFGQGSARVRKSGIVALARNLLMALCRFLETGVLPQGALCKSEVRSR